MSPTKRKKRSSDSIIGPSQTPEPREILIPCLPNDVALNCLARVPRCYHPVLSAVSKPIRSIVPSPQLFTARSVLNRTEHLLYLRVESSFQNDRGTRWLTVHRRLSPNARNDNKILVVVPVPEIPVDDLKWSAYAVVGAKIYALGGEIDGRRSSHVWVLDCRFHTWERGPSMLMARSYARAAVVDGKIYVMGGCGVEDSTATAAHWAEMLDPNAGLWEAIPSPSGVHSKQFITACAVMGGRIRVWVDEEELRLDPVMKTWEVVGSFGNEMELVFEGNICVVNEVLFFYDVMGTIKYFDERNREWKELKGVRKELPECMWGPGMVNVGGKLVMVMWAKSENGDGDELTEDLERRKMEVWYAEIEVKENGDNDLWGEVLVSKQVLSQPKSMWEWSPSVYNCMLVSF